MHEMSCLYYCLDNILNKFGDFDEIPKIISVCIKNVPTEMISKLLFSPYNLSGVRLFSI
jgi:hypothetical protein